MKKIAPIKPFWYSDVVIFPKLVTIITTMNKEGIVNAAPYACFMQYDSMNKNPRVIVGMSKFRHTFKNIITNNEFVVNFPQQNFLMT